VLAANELATILCIPTTRTTLSHFWSGTISAHLGPHLRSHRVIGLALVPHQHFSSSSARHAVSRLSPFGSVSNLYASSHFEAHRPDLPKANPSVQLSLLPFCGGDASLRSAHLTLGL
jgi:hypothetical protein